MKEIADRINEIVNNISGWSLKPDRITIYTYTDINSIIDNNIVLIVGKNKINIEIIYNCGPCIPQSLTEDKP